MRTNPSITRRRSMGLATGLFRALRVGRIGKIGSIGSIGMTVGVMSLFAGGCGTPGAVSGTPPGGSTARLSTASPGNAHIQAVYQSHCGSCHQPVAPGSEPSDRLEAELERHHKRTRLTESEWAGLGAFLVARP